MDVSENSGTPKWMVKIMEKPIKIDDLGVPPFKETPIYLEPVAPKLPIDQVTIELWFQIYRELEDEGICYIFGLAAIQ